MGLSIAPLSSASSRSSAQLAVLTLRSPQPSELRVISGDSSGFVRSLLAIRTRPSRFSRAQACGGVAAGIAAGCTRPGSVVTAAAAAAARPDADLAAAAAAEHLCRQALRLLSPRLKIYLVQKVCSLTWFNSSLINDFTGDIPFHLFIRPLQGKAGSGKWDPNIQIHYWAWSPLTWSRSGDM